MNNPIVLILFYVVIIGGFWWLLMRPQKKEQKRVQLMLSELAVGDTVLTTSGFYGVVIDITNCVSKPLHFQLKYSKRSKCLA